jgi:hypothetical protein
LSRFDRTGTRTRDRMRARVLVLALATMPLGCSLIAGLHDWREGDLSTGSEGGADADAAALDGPFGPDADAAAMDSPIDAPPGPDCDPNKPFDPPVVVPMLDTLGLEGGGRLSPDELTIYFSSNRFAGSGFDSTNLMVAKRSLRTSTFGAPTLLPSVNDDNNDYGPTVTGDGLTLFFTRETAGEGALFRSTRALVADPFGVATVVHMRNSPVQVSGAFLTENGSTVYFTERNGAIDSIRRAARPPIGSSVSGDVTVTELNTLGSNRTPVLSPDEMTIYFSSNRPSATKDGSIDDYDVWVAKRTIAGGAFGTPELVANVSSNVDDYPSWVSADDCRLYLFGEREVPGGGGGTDQAVWVATRPK